MDSTGKDLKERNALKLESTAADCDRAIVKLGMKSPMAMTADDIRFAIAALASARDALRWASVQVKS